MLYCCRMVSFAVNHQWVSSNLRVHKALCVWHCLYTPTPTRAHVRAPPAPAPALSPACPPAVTAMCNANAAIHQEYGHSDAVDILMS